MASTLRVRQMATKRSSKDVSPSTMTRMQELGSAWVFERAIKDNIVFNRPNDIVNDKKTYRSEERRVGKECRSRWSPYQ